MIGISQHIISQPIKNHLEFYTSFLRLYPMMLYISYVMACYSIILRYDSLAPKSQKMMINSKVRMAKVLRLFVDNLATSFAAA